jgi:type IV pilus assembly protein PilX
MNTSKLIRHRGAAVPTALRQQGVVLIFALVALAIMMLGAVALISSFNTALVNSGNIGFKRDLANRADVAAAWVVAQFNNAALPIGTPAGRGGNIPASNFSATPLPTNALGIPTALLLSDADFAAAWTADDLELENEIKVRYVVDRFCNTIGDSRVLREEACIRAPTGPGKIKNYAIDESRLKRQAELGGTTESGVGVINAVANPAAYRLSIKVSGPRDTQAFYQVSFTEPLPPPTALP